MSGGSYDYAYSRVQDFVDRLVTRERTAVRKAFRVHLVAVAEAMRAIEWEDSGDTGPERTEQAIRRALGGQYEGLLLSAIEAEHKRLGEEIEKLKASMRPTEAPKGAE